MKNIKILDCTLRDGGRIIDCEFGNDAILGIGKQLKRTGIDIIELGFLRDGITFNENSTFFPSVGDANDIVYKICKGDKSGNEKYVLFVDHGLYDISKLEKADSEGISGIRFGFTKKDFNEDRSKLLSAMNCIKDKGYDLYFQAVNTTGYKSEEIAELIKMANDICPISFGIVDTYGAMYLDDLEYIWNIVNEQLDNRIAIDFHSHNNMQMSFALTQSLIQLSNYKRNIIVDATLNGMGKCAGNLNTELIVDFLTRKHDYDYDEDIVLDAIDRYLYPIKKNCDWGYSIPAFMAGIYKAHPNNVIYLTEKYRLNSKDIKYIISGIDEKTRQRYDYDNIQKVYKAYCSTKINDEYTIKELEKIFGGKSVLILAPGKTIKDYNETIAAHIVENKPIVVCVNFQSKNLPFDYLFFANTIHWEKICDKVTREKCILSSNVHSDIVGTRIVDYSRLIVEESILYDNSTIMLLNLLKNLNVEEIQLAGFDGLKEGGNNYVNDTFADEKTGISCEKKNREIGRMFQQYKNKVEGKIRLRFLTPSIYERQ